MCVCVCVCVRVCVCACVCVCVCLCVCVCHSPLLKRGAMKRGENMHGSLSDDIICSKMRTVFPRAKSEENYELREQVMSKDKYTDIFSRQIEAIAFITLKIFCNAREKCLWTAYCLLRGTISFEFSGTTLWTNKYFPSRISPSFSRGIIGHVMHLDLSHTSKNIWLIKKPRCSSWNITGLEYTRNIADNKNTERFWY